MTRTVTVVVGGQYGSEGKGKVVEFLAQDRRVAAVIRVGGPNSGHTVHARGGERVILRQLPAAALLGNPLCLIGPGSYVNVRVLLEEMERFAIDPTRIVIDPNVVIVDDADGDAERAAGLASRISSTCSGTGAAVMKRVGRRAKSILASEAETLRPFLRDVPLLARKLASSNKRIIVEGTQGFGLSVLHSRDYPNVTTRDTSAAGALSEAGLSPLDVEDIVLVLRAFPIRVAGNSGPFHAEELTWEQLTKEGGHTEPLHERTSVTGKTRRVARFDPGVVRQAIAVNRPTTVVLNHVDYVDTTSTASSLSPRAVGFVGWVESEIGTRVDLIGLGPDVLLPRGAALGRVAAA